MTDLTPMQIKNLPLETLNQIINIRANDINVYIGKHGNILLTGDVRQAVLNGLSVQINLEQADLDDIMQNSCFQHAFKDLNLSTERSHQKCDWCGESYIPTRRRKKNASHVFCCRDHAYKFRDRKKKKPRREDK